MRMLALVSAFFGTIAMPLHAVTLNFSTSTLGGWTVSGGGAVNATPYAFGSELSITSTGTGAGTFVSGGSFAAFTGFWTAQYSIFLPADASNITLTYSNLYADDRAVFTLNGARIGATGIPYQGNSSSGGMTLSDAGSALTYSFDGPSGSVSGTITSGFNLGGINTLQGIVNNTGTGIYGPTVPIYAGSSNDGTHLGMDGVISYSVPEPSAWSLVALGAFLLSLRGRANPR